MTGLRLTHIGLCVADLERSLTFYCEGLGFQRISDLALEGEPAATLLELPDVALQAVYLERDGFRLELLHYPRPGALGDRVPRPMNQLGLTHLSFQVDRLDEVLNRLCKLGGKVIEKSRIDIPAMGAAAVFLTDPDGTRIELVQLPHD